MSRRLRKSIQISLMMAAMIVVAGLLTGEAGTALWAAPLVGGIAFAVQFVYWTLHPEPRTRL